MTVIARKNDEAIPDLEQDGSEVSDPLTPQTSVLSTQSSALSPQHSVLSTQSSVLSPQSSVLSPQSSVLSPQSSALSDNVTHTPLGRLSPYKSTFGLVPDPDFRLGGRHIRKLIWRAANIRNFRAKVNTFQGKVINKMQPPWLISYSSRPMLPCYPSSGRCF
jgi:hypothetical protein